MYFMFFVFYIYIYSTFRIIASETRKQTKGKAKLKFPGMFEKQRVRELRCDRESMCVYLYKNYIFYYLLTIILLYIGIALGEVIFKQTLGQRCRRIDSIDCQAAVLCGQHLVGLLPGQILERGGLLLTRCLELDHTLQMRLHHIDHLVLGLCVNLLWCILDDRCLCLQLLNALDQSLIHVGNGTIQTIHNWCCCGHGACNAIFGGI